MLCSAFLLHGFYGRLWYAVLLHLFFFQYLFVCAKSGRQFEKSKGKHGVYPVKPFLNHKTSKEMREAVIGFEVCSLAKTQAGGEYGGRCSGEGVEDESVLLLKLNLPKLKWVSYKHELHRPLHIVNGALHLLSILNPSVGYPTR